MNLPVDLRLSSEVDGVDRLFCDNSFMDYTPLDRLRAVWILKERTGAVLRVKPKPYFSKFSLDFRQALGLVLLWIRAR
jgi:hypothetical protein